MRNLATIQTIKSLEKIPGKDRILYASFESVGFRVIVSADLKVGDKVIYCEVDSLLPVRPEFEFLRARCFNEKWNGFRIRNMKMCSLYSEGLVLPLSVLKQTPGKFTDGMDLTKALGIVKYDPEALEEKSANQQKRSWFMTLLYRISFVRAFLLWLKPKERYAWPSWASKSDETRAQNLGYIFTDYHGQDFIVSEKLDGQSCLFGIYKGKIHVGSRNFLLKDPRKGGQKNNYWEYAIAHGIEKKMKALRQELGVDFYIQGELCGPGIQSNKYGFTEREFFVFNMKIIGSNYVQYGAMKACLEKYEIKVVPLVDTIVWRFKNMTELLKYADGYSVFGDKVLREGVVIRTVTVEGPDKGQSNMKSFKVISPSFDLKYNT